MKLFEYAVIYLPKSEKDQKQLENAKLIVPVTQVLAVDMKMATMIAARSIPEDYVSRLDQCEVAVRPF